MNSSPPTIPGQEENKLTFKVLGRMLEHFGVHMYKRREVAFAELISNSWDAGATRVEVHVPDAGQYDKRHSAITVRDNGCGMKFQEVRDCFLVIGRNRRKVSGLEI